MRREPFLWRGASVGVAAVMLALGMLLAPAGESPTRAADAIRPFPWGAEPQGFIVFSSEGVRDENGEFVIGGGLFAATRDCAALTCVYRLTDDPNHHDPAWDPTGQFVWFATELCDDGEMCAATVGSVDTATGEVSTKTPLEGEDRTEMWTPAPSFDATRVAVTMTEIVPGDPFPLASSQIGALEGIALRKLSTFANSGDTCGGGGAGRQAPRWSPVSEQIAFIRKDGCGVRVFIADAGDINGSERHIPTPLDWTASEFIPESVPGPAGVDWSPDGSRLVVSGQDQGGECGQYVIPIDGGGPLALEGRLGCLVGEHPRWSPDDKLIAIMNSLLAPDGSGLLRECVDRGRCFGPPMDPPAGGITVPGSADGHASDPQCTPGTCLTLIRVHKIAEDLSAQRYPATFTFTAEYSGGASTDDVTLTGDPFVTPDDPSRIASLRVKAGLVTVREMPASGWKPSAIECRRPGAVPNLAAGSVTLEVPEGSITDCVFTNDPGEFVLPSGGPTPSPSPSTDCARHDTWTREWAARGWGIDMLLFRVVVPFCASPSGVQLTGGISVTGEAAEFRIADLLSPIDFEWVPDDMEWDVKREASGALVVDASGRFNACSSIFEIIGYVAVPLRAAKTAAKFVPEKVLVRTVDRLLESVEEWLFRALKRIPGVKDEHILQYTPKLVAFFQRQFRPVKEAIMTFLLDPAAEAGAEAYFEQFVDLFDLCVSTWSPEAQVRFSPPTGQAAQIMIGDASAFWDIVDNGP